MIFLVPRPRFRGFSFASEGSTAFLLPVASRIIHPGAVTPWMRCHPIPFQGRIASHSLWVWQDGRPNATRFRFRSRFNPATCCHVASTHIGKQNPTCLLAAEGIVQGSRTELHACTPPFLVVSSCPGNAGRNGASGKRRFRHGAIFGPGLACEASFQFERGHIHVSRPRRATTHRFYTGTTLAGSQAIPGRTAG